MGEAVATDAMKDGGAVTETDEASDLPWRPTCLHHGAIEELPPRHDNREEPALGPELADTEPMLFCHLRKYQMQRGWRNRIAQYEFLG